MQLRKARMAKTSDFLVKLLWKICSKIFCYVLAQDYSDYIHEFPSLHRDHLHNYKYMKCT